MKRKTKVAIVLVFGVMVLLISVFVGGHYISPREILSILWSKISGAKPVLSQVNNDSVVLDIRLPRIFLAFLAGALLSVSGVVMQSLMQNPIASSYTLGVSSGAALMVTISMVTGLSIPILGIFSQSFIGFLGGIGTILLIMVVATKLDKGIGNITIVLLGMAVSLFLAAIQTLIMSISRESLQKIVSWQMGSLVLRDPRYNIMLLIFGGLAVAVLASMAPQLDNMTFGDEIAFTSGIDVKKTKLIVFAIGGALTGATVSVVGIIGFVDLVIPHITRRIFGSSHRIVIPMAAVLGGCFLTLSDIVARTIISPQELPIGVVTALVGVPFFIYIFFRKERAL